MRALWSITGLGWKTRGASSDVTHSREAHRAAAVSLSLGAVVLFEGGLLPVPGSDCSDQLCLISSVRTARWQRWPVLWGVVVVTAEFLLVDWVFVAGGWRLGR